MTDYINDNDYHNDATAMDYSSDIEMFAAELETAVALNDIAAVETLARDIDFANRKLRELL